MHIVSYMVHTKIYHIIINGVLQCILCLWRESDSWIKRVLNSFCLDSFCCDSLVDDAAYVVLRVGQLAVYFTCSHVFLHLMGK